MIHIYEGRPPIDESIPIDSLFVFEDIQQFIPCRALKCDGFSMNEYFFKNVKQN